MAATVRTVHCTAGATETANKGEPSPPGESGGLQNAAFGTQKGEARRASPFLIKE